MDTQTLLKSATDALKVGNKTLAREQLMKVVEVDETNEQAWLWLAGAVEEPAEMRICLENVLHLNSNNQRAQQGLAWLRQKNPAVFLDDEPAPAPAAPVQTTPSPTIALDSPKPNHAMTGATIALDSPKTAPMPPIMASASYYVPNADGSNLTQNAAPIQPCPRCGKDTKLADKRCRACGQSLMVSVFRTDANPRYAKLAGLFSLIYSGFVTFMVVVALLLVGVAWSFVKTETLSQLSPAQRKNVPARIQLQLDDIFNKAFQPAFTILAIILVICVIWIVVSIGVRRLNKTAYIVNWFFVLPIGLGQLLSVLRFAGERDQLVVLRRQLPAQMQDVITGYVAGFVIGTLFVAAMVIFMVLSWKNFTKQSVRFIANDPETNNAMQHFNRGVQYNRQGYKYQAMLEWQRAVRANPNDATYHHALGLSYASLQRPAEAMDELKAALNIAPNDAKIATDLQRIQTVG